MGKRWLSEAKTEEGEAHDKMRLSIEVQILPASPSPVRRCAPATLPRKGEGKEPRLWTARNGQEVAERSNAKRRQVREKLPKEATEFLPPAGSNHPEDGSKWARGG